MQHIRQIPFCTDVTAPHISAQTYSAGTNIHKFQQIPFDIHGNREIVPWQKFPLCGIRTAMRSTHPDQLLLASDINGCAPVKGEGWCSIVGVVGRECNG